MIAKELTLTRNKSKASEVFGHGGKNPFLFVLYLFCCVVSIHFMTLGLHASRVGQVGVSC